MTADDWDDEYEDDESDLDEGSSTLRCPSCRHVVYYDAEQCPHCGQYILDEDLPSSSSAAWTSIWRVTAVVLLLLFVGPVIAMLIWALG